MKKWLIGGGIAVAVLGIGYYVLRKRDSELGDDFIDYSKRYFRYYGYASDQIKLAKAGSRLSSYKGGANAGEMINTSSTDAEAYMKAAYWLAVASRLTGDAGTASAASSFQTKGKLIFSLPLSSYLTGSIEQIMQDAAAKLPRSSNAGIKSIGVILGRQADSHEVDTKRLARQGTTEIAWEAAKETAKDLKKPYDYLTKPKPWWHKWAWGAGLSVVALVALRLAFSREYHALSGLISKKPTPEPKQIEQKEAA